MTYDVIIIGAGPAGLTAGIYARSKMMNTLIIESGRVGGQLVSLYPEKGVHNFPGFESVQARKLSDRLYAQAENLECEIREREKALEIRDGNEDLVVVTNKGEYHTLTVIIAIGMGDFNPRKMGVPGEDELFGKGVSYLLPVKEELVGQKVTMFGGGNSAIEMALIADSVTDTTIVHRRGEFRADEMNVFHLERSNILKVMNAETISFNGTEKLESVTVKQDNRTFEIPTDLAVINIGIKSDLGILDKWGLDLTPEGLVKVNLDMSTNRRGVFACGDVVDYPGKYKQIITACGEAANAVQMAYKFSKKPYWA
ncbi:MAG: ferredoxin/flavodoxin---NADP+ reductase [Candidatus Methanomethylophilaceae archaeon]|nr:ferredoxin/flavodoxin---NADP+ reductase [Candidatus Methanomethylophilaceae archaeon]